MQKHSLPITFNKKIEVMNDTVLPAIGIWPHKTYQFELSEDIIKMMSLLSASTEFEPFTYRLDTAKISFKDIDLLKIIEPEDNLEYNLFGKPLTTDSFSMADHVIDEDSSSTLSQRKQNRDLLERFNSYNDKFVYMFHHISFEDGCNNEITETFDEMLKEDPIIAMVWMSGFYTDHQTDHDVIEGLLRLIALMEYPEFRKYILPIVKASFNDEDAAVQEAAIMVAENWRNQMCLDSLLSTKFSSEWMQDYANRVIGELISELKR